jgi:hypothetical protein
MDRFACHPSSSPPTDSSTPSLVASPTPSLRPLEALEHHSWVELYVVPRSMQIDAEERALDLTLVVVIDGSRLSVTIVEVKRWLEAHYGIPGGSVTVSHFYQEDILITFSFYDELL